jgi:hypothetical protein
MANERTDLASNLACYADSYSAARAKLQLVAAETGGVITTHVHPHARGPDDGSLSIDVASFGPRNTRRGLLILSGTHGAEGYTGSALQIALMHTGALAALPPDTRVVLVHGLNPYGFAHGTRTTEHNVDLNRNFIDFSLRLPSNPAYLELHEALCPRDWTPEVREASTRAIATWIEKNGPKAWLDSSMKGQYDDPTGLNYGGRAPEWSHRTLREIVAQEFPAVQRLAVIDWHTGLGEWGEPFFLCFNERNSQEWERACDWWGRERVENEVGFEGGARPPYNGLVFYGVRGMVAPAQVTGGVIEFGTGPIQTTYEQLRADRWLRFGEVPADPALIARMRAEVRESFTPTDPQWRSRVIDHGRDIQLQTLEGLARWQ